MTLRTVAAAALVSASLSALAEGTAPPPGWGEPKPPPPANGTGNVTFMHGAIAVELPLNQVEINQLSKDPLLQLVSLDFVDAKDENRFQFAFSTQGKAGATSKGNFRQSRCGLTVTKLSAREVEGAASCAPMFEMDATTSAKPVTAIKFSAKLN